MQSCHDFTGASLTVRGDRTFAGGASFATKSEQLWPLVSRKHHTTASMFERKNHTEFAHAKAHEDSLWNGVTDLLAKGERNTDNYTTARNSTQRSSHLRPQPTLQTCSRDTGANDSDAFMCDVFHLNDDDDAIINIDRARPHHIMEG